MKLSYLKQVIKEEIEKALAEAETKDPGLNQKDFPETFRVINKIADFLKSNNASRVNINPEIAANKMIKLPGLFSRTIRGRNSESFEPEFKFLRTYLDYIKEINPNIAREFGVLLDQFVVEYHKEKRLLINKPKVDAEIAAADKRQSNLGQIRRSFGVKQENYKKVYES